MKTKWILQTNIFKEKAVEKMIECFQRQDLPFDLVKIIPFSDELPIGITEYDNEELLLQQKQNVLGKEMIFAGNVRMNSFFHNPEFIIDNISSINLDDLLTSLD